MRSRLFNKYLRKNTLNYMLPALIVLVALLCVTYFFYPKLNFKSVAVTDTAGIESAYNAGGLNVRFHIDRAEYLGCDYYENNKVYGRYYYTIIDDKCVIFIAHGTLDALVNYDIKGKVIEDQEIKNTITAGLKESIFENAGTVSEDIFPYVISEAHYPKLKQGILLVVLGLTGIVSILIILRGLFWLIAPHKTKSIKSIGGVANGKLVLKNINYDLYKGAKIDDGKIIITEHFIISPSRLFTDVILRENIKKIDVEKRDKENILIIVDRDGVTYEQSFKNQVVFDSICRELQNVNQI